MAPEMDIWRTAPLLIRQHGEDADIVAPQRVDALWQREGYEGHAIWLRSSARVWSFRWRHREFPLRRAGQGRVHQGT
jgi:hypothetical protein